MRRMLNRLITLAAIGGIVWVSSARSRAAAKDRPLGDVLAMDLRSFVTHRFDPLVLGLGLAGGRVSPWAVLEHVGRTTGSVHRTPVTPHLHDDRMTIPLPYGTDVQWVRNVLAAGHCRVQLHESIYELDEPTIVMPDDVPDLSPAAHEALDMSGSHYLRLHVLDRAPGTFANPPREFTTHGVTSMPELAIEHPTEGALSRG